MGKQQVALKEYCMEYWLKELQESMDRWAGCPDILLKTALNTIQSVNQWARYDSLIYHCYNLGQTKWNKLLAWYDGYNV